MHGRVDAVPGSPPRIGAVSTTLEIEVSSAGQIDMIVGSLFTMEVDESQIRLVGNFSLGMGYEVFRDDPTPADGDDIGTLRFSGRDSGGAKQIYAEIFAEIIDFTAGTEDGRMDFLVMSGGGFGFFMSGEGNATTSIEKIGFRGASAQAAQTWSATGHSVDRSLGGDTNAELRNVLGTLINDLEAMGLLA